MRALVAWRGGLFLTENEIGQSGRESDVVVPDFKFHVSYV